MREDVQSKMELEHKFLKLEIQISELKSIVLRQSVTIQNLMDENRAIKRLLESKK